MNESPGVDPETAAAASSAGRRRALIAGAIAIVAALVIGGVVVAANGSDDSSSPGTGAKPGSSTSSTSERDSSNRSTVRSTPKVTRRDGSPAPTLRDGSPAPTLADGSPAPTRPGGSPAPTKPSGGAVGTTVPGPLRTLPPDTVPPTVRQAYIAAYDRKCASIWSIALSDGLLWDVEDASNGPFRVQFCRDLKIPEDSDFYDTPEDAQQGGEDDAVFNLQLELIGFELRNTDGSRIWSE